MPNLKDLKGRISSVKSTQKITSAMKVVAASKLNRAKLAAKAAEPYAERMANALCAIAESVANDDGAPELLVGTGKADVHLVVVATADRGLCGAFNSSIVRKARKSIAQLEAAGKQVKIFCVGRKGYDQLRMQYKKQIVEYIPDITKKAIDYSVAEKVGDKILELFDKKSFDVCSVIYSTFKSAISQEVTHQQLIPLDVHSMEYTQAEGASAVYEYEPTEEEILTHLLPLNIKVQIYHVLLENAASEQGAKMTAMDNATRNAGKMIKRLTLQYNRTRQAAITKELIEIISGAEAI